MSTDLRDPQKEINKRRSAEMYRRGPRRPKQKCGTCRFLEVVGGAGGGACCRYPPQVNVVVNPVRQDAEWSNDRPYMNDAQWCGEWQDRGQKLREGLVVFGNCIFCTKAFKAKRSSARYCSESCRQLAYQKRREEKRKQKGP